ncbi:MAG: sigma-54-dependent Fis family transcriptional regulator [Planctomycetota bacterium]|nr:MAG: sigma-54-dependent Fis family transcriptional regulator [Planctomycetota bacterium]
MAGVAAAVPSISAPARGWIGICWRNAGHSALRSLRSGARTSPATSTRPPAGGERRVVCRRPERRGASRRSSRWTTAEPKTQAGPTSISVRCRLRERCAGRSRRAEFRGIVVSVATPQIDLLVVDDDDAFRSSLVRRFQRRGFNVSEAASAEEALELIARRLFDVAVVDMVMPGMSGLELLERMRELNPHCQCILLTGQATVESAVQAMKLGAYDYLRKPFPLAELEVVLQKAYERHQLSKENAQLRELLHRSEEKWEMIGHSPVMQDVFRLIERAGPSDKPILILGESGTGKELVARALHACSPRKDKPFVAINCAALPDQLLESELFGHEKGAFTGATASRPGLFEVADGGTLFIDEIGEMSPMMQVKLLRVLEDGSMRRVGSNQERRVNIRLISATNRDLEKLVQEGSFREDLLYRINVLSIELPPLREREGDIPPLVARYLGEGWEVDPEAMECLQRYHWPGNVRQLINVLERSKIMAEANRVTVHDLPRSIVEAVHEQAAHRGGSPNATPVAAGSGPVVDSGPPPTVAKPSHPRAPAAGNLPPTDNLAAVERFKVVEVLRRCHGNKSRAAKALGVTRRSLYRLLEKHAIREDEYLNNGSYAG